MISQQKSREQVEMEINLSKHKSIQFGEITRTYFNPTFDFEHGMPLRGGFDITKEIEHKNKYTDFDLYSTQPNKIIDGTNGEEINYTEIKDSQQKITVNSSTKFYISEINRLNCQKFLKNGYGLFNLMAKLYYSSDGNCEQNLRDVFNFHKKNIIISTLTKIENEILQKKISFENFIIYAPEIKIKNKIIDCYPIHQINNKLSEHRISQRTLEKCKVCLVNVCRINIVWDYPIDKVIKIKSFSAICFTNNIFNFYQDKNTRTLEVPCFANRFVFGFVSGKIDDYDTMCQIFNNLRPTTFDQVIVPIFNFNTKIRILSLLKKLGLHTMFNHSEFPEFFTGGNINDAIQITKLSLSTKTNKNFKKTKKYNTLRNFIVNCDFQFYFKNVKLDLILIMDTFRFR